MPYQSCQKLAVIHCVPNRNEVMARYAGTGLFGSHARSSSTTAGSCFRYSSTSAFHFAKALRALAFVNAGDPASSSFICAFIESEICANLSVAERSAANCSASLPVGTAAALGSSCDSLSITAAPAWLPSRSIVSRSACAWSVASESNPFNCSLVSLNLFANASNFSSAAWSAPACICCSRMSPS